LHEAQELPVLKSLSKFEPTAYALLRIASGALFAFHGLQILFGLLSSMPTATFGTQFWLGGCIELVGGLAVMLGWRCRLAAFLCSGTMAVAYCQFHWKFQMDRQFFPALNQGEMALMNSFVFLLIATRGPGKWGLER
jgi:putative oxidoreductase